MTVIWCDTETTGLDPRDSGPFEIAFLVYRDSKFLGEKLFHLNPLSEEVVIHPEALEVNGATEEQIRAYPPACEVVPEMVKYFEQFQTIPPESFVFAGYNCPFDYGQISALLFRQGKLLNEYFSGRFIDVLELVKKAKGMNLLPTTRDNKLETMTKSLDITHDSAHTAMADIKATRQLYEAIYIISRREKK